MSKAFKQMNWPTFLFTVFLSALAAVFSYASAVGEIKEKIAESNVKEEYFKAGILELKIELKEQRKEIYEIKALLIQSKKH